MIWNGNETAQAKEAKGHSKKCAEKASSANGDDSYPRHLEQGEKTENEWILRVSRGSQD